MEKPAEESAMLEPKLRETELRRSFAIPDDAQRVLIFAESTHWDPNWTYTSEEYFEWRVRRTLDEAIDELTDEADRVFGIECTFFLKMYWERVPERRKILRQLINEERLRLTGSGVTTPDTLLPPTEALMRDYLLGQEWLRSNGMVQEPRLAYFPDCFGHAPTLPSLLQAMGFAYAAITRVDGMFFLGCDYELPRNFPKSGSSAELLTKNRAQDFIWRGPDGAEVLAHWNAFNYGHGELLAHSGITRVLGLPFAIPNRREGHVARRIDKFARELERLSPTPYLLCVSGFDFASPIRGLNSLLDRYNKKSYPTTGTWALNAGLDDYMALVDCHRDKLPTFDLDPNPYWTGFYAARPSLKALYAELIDKLVLAEKLVIATEDIKAAQKVADELSDAWQVATVANHHDFITGTSPDKVYESEQRPWLSKALTQVDEVLDRLTPPNDRELSKQSKAIPEWKRDGDQIEVRTSHFSLIVDAAAGGAIVAGYANGSDQPIITGPSNDFVVYSDSGGLWRMGHEYKGGRFDQQSTSSNTRAELKIRERQGYLELEIASLVDSLPSRRWIWIDTDSPYIRMRSEVTAKERKTVAIKFRTAIGSKHGTMDAPAGVIERPWEKGFSPTFWPASSFCHIVDEQSGLGFALAFSRTASISSNGDGEIQMVVARNATREQAFGLLPIPAHPAKGHDSGTVHFDYAMLFTPKGDWHENSLDSLATHLHGSDPHDPLRKTRQDIADGAVELSGDASVIALKPASRGDGLIVRIATNKKPGTTAELSLPAEESSQHGTATRAKGT